MRTTLITALLILGLAPGAVAASGGLPVAYPKNPAPVRPAYVPQGAATVPDCGAAVPVTVTAATDTTLNADTTGGVSLVDVYGCEPWDESGPEAVFELQVDEDVLLSVALDSPLADLDVFLLSDCDGDSCLAAHISQFTVDLPARAEPYYLVVDGYRGDEGAFNLTLTARPGLLSQLACDGATDVACEDIDIVGNIIDKPNLVTMADCGAYQAFGGEDWYRLTLPDRAELDIDLDGSNFDAVLWLFDDCGSDPVCLDYADAGVSSEPESISFTNDSGAEITVLLGVDATRAVSTENGDSEPNGAFNLTIACAVPVAAEETSFGGLKSMFR